jgi:hypothetical protein
VKTKIFIEGDAALKNFTGTMAALFRATKTETKKSRRRSKIRNRKVNERS